MDFVDTLLVEATFIECFDISFEFEIRNLVGYHNLFAFTSFWTNFKHPSGVCWT